MAFVNAKTRKRITKALFIGPPGAGKTYPGLQLEGPIAALCGEDGLRPYSDVFDFDIDTFDTIEEVNAKLRDEFLGKPEVCAKYNSVLIDGLTVAWHAAFREIAAGRERIEVTDQARLKSPWKEFNELVFKLGKRNKNVWATVQAKIDWDIRRSQAPKMKGMRGDVEDRIWYAFDIVCYVDVVEGVRQVRFLKSRYPHLFQVGDVIEHFDVKTHFAPIFNGTAQRMKESSPAEEELERTREIIQTKLRELGSVARGGVIPDDEARRIYTIANSSQSPEELSQALADLRAIEANDTAGAA